MEYTGLAFVSWPFGQIGVVRREALVAVLYDILEQLWGQREEGITRLKVAFEEPGPTNSYTWEVLGRIRAIIECWAFEHSRVEVIADRPVRAQEVKARMDQVPLLLDTLEPLEVTHEGLSERLPIHAREALATLIR